MEHVRGCQIPSLQGIAEGRDPLQPKLLKHRIKRMLAKPWNYHVKKWLKKSRAFWSRRNSQHGRAEAHAAPGAHLKSGDWVRVRSGDEIRSTLNGWRELKGCAFLDDMWQYCGSVQRVLQPLERFLDERDYKVKRCSGVVLLENVICRGTPVFGRCDRGCFLFWREEWLEKLESAQAAPPQQV